MRTIVYLQRTATGGITIEGNTDLNRAQTLALAVLLASDEWSLASIEYDGTVVKALF